MSNLPRTLSLTLFSVPLLAASWVHCAVAGPVIEWVTPPVWLQTQTENTSALPGTELNESTWISTGRGGRAVVTMGREQVEIDENSLWEWSGRDDGSTGNTIQGRMRVSTVLPKGATAQEGNSSHSTPRLYRSAPWMLILDAGDDQTAAERLVLFLKNSGYPVGDAQKKQLDSGVMWQIGLEGLQTNEAAVVIGTHLLALAPAIFSATPKFKNSVEAALAGVPTKLPDKVMESAVEKAEPAAEDPPPERKASPSRGQRW